MGRYRSNSFFWMCLKGVLSVSRTYIAQVLTGATRVWKNFPFIPRPNQIGHMIGSLQMWITGKLGNLRNWKYANLHITLIENYGKQLSPVGSLMVPQYLCLTASPWKDNKNNKISKYLTYLIYKNYLFTHVYEFFVHIYTFLINNQGSN